MGTTIKDVAAASGVSIATVSHVINKTRYVSPQVTEKVHSAIKELNYYPNLIVRSLRNKKTYTIGLILPNISNELYGSLAENIQKILFRTGYSLILCNTSYDLSLETQALNTFIMKKADAIIIIPVSENSEKLLEIQKLGIPLLVLDRVVKNMAVDSVRIDNFKGEYDGITYLIGLGHKKIGYIDRKSDMLHLQEQKMGFKRALEDHGIRPNDDYIVRAPDFNFRAGIETAKALIKRNPEITAISCYYDIIAFGAMRGLIDMGYRIPDDISVLGFDGMPFTEASSPRLTTLFTSVSMLAQEACRIILKKLDQKHAHEQDRASAHIVPALEEHENIMIAPELIVRESTGPVREQPK